VLQDGVHRATKTPEELAEPRIYILQLQAAMFKFYDPPTGKLWPVVD